MLETAPPGPAGLGGLPAERDVLLDWHGRDRLVAVSSNGIYYTLDDGREVLDGSGMSVASVGHSHPAVAAAIAEQVRRLSFSPRQFVSEKQLQLGARIRELAPGPLTRSWFGPGGGAVGVEAAVHLALWYQQARGEGRRRALISWDGSYHGGTMMTAGAGGYEAHRRLAEPFIAPGAVWHADPLPAEGGTAAGVASGLEALIARAGEENVAALIAEPVSGSLTGALTGPDGWLAAARDVCTRHGIVMIADETMTGFGRTGDWFACGRDPSTVPDILVAGKLMSSGHFPLTTVTATEAVFRVLREARAPWPVRYTNAGHPVALAAALAVIDLIEDGDLVANAARRGSDLRGLLEDLADARPYLGRPTGRGLQIGVPVLHPGGGGPADAAGLLAAITGAGIERHGILLTGGTGVDGMTVKVLLTPPLSVTRADCEELARRFAATVDDVTARWYGARRP